MNTRTLTGRVTRTSGRYFVVETDGPGDLKTLNLVKGQMYGAVVGDTVELMYYATASSGLWVVTKILSFA
jgi:hypothetical protein